MPTLLQDRPVDTAPAARPRSRRRVPKKLIAAGVGVAVAVPLVNAVGDWISGWGSPLEREVVDRSTPPLLLALDDLHEYHAATADLQVMVDVEIDTPWVPSIISGERVHFMAVGTADAYVDFENLDGDADHPLRRRRVRHDRAAGAGDVRGAHRPGGEPRRRPRPRPGRAARRRVHGEPDRRQRPLRAGRAADRRRGGRERPPRPGRGQHPRHADHAGDVAGRRAGHRRLRGSGRRQRLVERERPRTSPVLGSGSAVSA